MGLITCLSRGIAEKEPSAPNSLSKWHGSPELEGLTERLYDAARFKLLCHFLSTLAQQKKNSRLMESSNSLNLTRETPLCPRRSKSLLGTTLCASFHMFRGQYPYSYTHFTHRSSHISLFSPDLFPVLCFSLLHNSTLPLETFLLLPICSSAVSLPWMLQHMHILCSECLHQSQYRIQLATTVVWSNVQLWPKSNDGRISTASTDHHIEQKKSQIFDYELARCHTWNNHKKNDDFCRVIFSSKFIRLSFKLFSNIHLRAMHILK